MKEIIFTEEQLRNLEEIGRDLFDDEQDPRSSSYIRMLKRPPISWINIILNMLIPVVTLAILVAALRCFGFSTTIAVLVAVAILIVYILLMLKRIIICLIHIYQRYAPDSLRNKCRFEPSCSEYMILSIEKYGLMKGLRQGLCRLKRCNTDGGGFDFP